jgi:hypothetical protein
MSDLKSKRAPATDTNQRAWEQVYDDINTIIKAVNNKSGVESRNGASGNDGDIRLFKDVDRTKYFIEGRFGDGWAKRELLFSDTSDAGQDESINFSSTESYVKPDGTVPFTGRQTGVAPQNTNELATKGYADTGRLTSITKSTNNLVFGMTDTASNITFTGFGANAFNSTAIPTTFVASLTNADASGQTLIEASTGSLYRLGGGDNITVTTDDPGGGQTWVQIDCDINTSNFLGSSVNRIEGIRTFDTDTFTATQTMGSGGYIVLDEDNSNVIATFNTVTVGGTSYPSVRLNSSTYTHPTSAGNKHVPSGGSSGQFLKYSSSGTAVWATPSYTTNTNYYLDGITKSSNTLTFSVNGATNQTYTFGSNAFNSTSYLTGITSTLATNESASPVRVSLLDDSSTIKALEEGSGISIETSATGGGDTVKISSTVNTSGLLSNGLVKVEDYNGSSVEEYANASGGDTLRFVENDGIEWSISGPTNNVISVTPSLSGYNSSNWNTAYTHSQSTHAPTNAEQNVQSDWNAGSGDSHILNKPSIPTRGSLGIDTDDTVRFGDVEVDNNLWINGYADSTASRIRFHHNGSNAYQDWETGAYYMRYDTTTKFMYDSSGNFHADADVYAYSTSVGSDKKLKKNIKDIKYGLKDVLKLRGVDFDWKEKRDGVHDIGVIAQEVKEVIPEVVQEVRDLVEDTYLSVDYAKLVPVLIEAIKELKEEVDGLRKS